MTPSFKRTLHRVPLLLLTGVGLVLATTGGCGEGRTGGGLKRGPRSTDIDPVQATATFWWDKPAQAKVTVPDFDKAVAACRGAMQFRMFSMDRFDARAGTLTSLPVVGAQWFEPWRQDNTTTGDVLRSSMATYRRTVRFDIIRTPDGRYTVAPKVLVERQTVIGQRISGSVGGYQRYIYADQTPFGLRDDAGKSVPTDYWYAVGRDYNLELELVEAVVGRLY